MSGPLSEKRALFLWSIAHALPTDKNVIYSFAFYAFI